MGTPLGQEPEKWAALWASAGAPEGWGDRVERAPGLGSQAGSQQPLSPRPSSCCWVPRARAALPAPGVTVCTASR